MNKTLSPPANITATGATATVDLAKQLVAIKSVTPDDKGCQLLLQQRLQALGFVVENMPFGPVSNFWARLGTQSPLFAFAGHTDVVPPGATKQWHSPPFEPCIKGDYLYGRGAQDMKGALAAMITAIEGFCANGHEFTGSIAMLITSDEEGLAHEGTLKVMDVLQKRNEIMDWCLIGEPSSEIHLGDTIKHGRRGSLSCHMQIAGKQGHVAYPQKAVNPIHITQAILNQLTNRQWDQGDADFPSSCFQSTYLKAGDGPFNVIPANCESKFNFRFSPLSPAVFLQQQVEEVVRQQCQQAGARYELDWFQSGDPFITRNSPLIDAAISAIKNITGQNTRLSTAGGTSDGRFIAPSGVDVIELGLCNDTIHQVNECVKVDHLQRLSHIYQNILLELLG